MQNISFSLKNFQLEKTSTKKKKLISAAEECRLDASFQFTILELIRYKNKKNKTLEQLFCSLFYENKSWSLLENYETIDVKLLKILRKFFGCASWLRLLFLSM